MRTIAIFCFCIFAIFSVIAAAQENTGSSTNQTQEPTGQSDQTSQPANQPNQTISPENQAQTPPQPQPAEQPSGTTGTVGTTGTTDTTTTGTENTNTAGAGATGSYSTAGASPAPSEAPKFEVTKHGRAVASFNGRGDKQTRVFKLSQGPATFDVTLNWERPDISLRGNAGNFAVVLADENHKAVDTVVATIDYFDGARTIDIPASGNYMLHITAPGNWSVKIEQ